MQIFLQNTKGKQHAQGKRGLNYYAHGPLARVEYGNNHVQGVDYYYTIQGWIKGVNSNILSPHNDGGQDGLTATGTIHNNFGKDAYGYTLGYFSGDYSPIDTSKWNTVTKRFEANTASSSLLAARYNLYNGNIGHMVTTIIQPDTNYASQTILPQGAAYKYDQLNRLIEMKAFVNLTNNAFGSTTYNGSYNNRFAYDANGNILSQIRKDQNGVTFDSLTYHYNIQNGQKQQNRLYHVNDTVSASVMNDDIDNQGSYNNALTQVNKVNNYKYDQIGNLVRDSAEGIATIDWTVYGKIKSITHRTGYYKMIATDTVRPPDLVFNYDAAGNRISKIVKPRTATGLKASTYQTMQYYVRDAQGNVLSVYNQRDSTAISTLYFKQTEKHIYGSSRLGIDATQKELIGATFSNDTSNHYLGNKSYELSNHLGNVLTTISDKKMPLDTNHDNTIDFYVADIRSATDYYPFGSGMKARTWNAGASKYGFNGKEKDDEVKGSGNSYDYGDRIQDPRLGRWWSIDKKFIKYPDISPYAFAINNPILFIDADGKDINIQDPETGKTHTFHPGDPVPDGASKFVQESYASLQHLHDEAGKTANTIVSNLVADHDYKVTIIQQENFGAGETGYEATTQELSYNPREGIITGEKNEGSDRQSPAVGLLHELDHADKHRGLLKEVKSAEESKDKEKIKTAKKAMKEYKSLAEEQRVTQGSEAEAAKTLKQGVRKDYDDVKGIYKSDSPTTTGNGVPTKKEAKQIKNTNGVAGPKQ